MTEYNFFVCGACGGFEILCNCPYKPHTFEFDKQPCAAENAMRINSPDMHTDAIEMEISDGHF